MTDTHCHLDFEHFDTDRDAVLARAAEAGVGRIVIPATDLATSRRALALAERQPRAAPALRVAVGVHPTSTGDFGADTLAELRELLQHPQVDALGEIGIDLYWKTVTFEKQVEAFRAQLALAAEAGRPVIIHDRDAHGQVIAVLRDQAPPAGVVLHSFSGDAGMAEAALEAGYYLGVDGPLTYKKNDALRAIFAAAPLERILVETDAPYLTPQPRRGQRNEPAFVRFVAERLAEVRGMSYEAVAAATTANAARLFRWEFVE